MMISRVGRVNRIGRRSARRAAVNLAAAPLAARIRPRSPTASARNRRQGYGKARSRSGRLVQLPDDDAQMRASGHGRVAGAERGFVQVDGEPLLEGGAHSRAGDAGRHTHPIDRTRPPHRQAHAEVHPPGERRRPGMPTTCAGRRRPTQAAPLQPISARPEGRVRRPTAPFRRAPRGLLAR